MNAVLKRIQVAATVMVMAGSIAAAEPFRPNGSHADFSGSVEPKVASPGDTLTLTLTASPQAPYYIYGYALTDESIVSKATLIAITKKPSWERGQPKASAKPLTKAAALPKEPPVKYHKEPVSWRIQFKVPKNAAAAEYDLSGLVGFQTCTDKFCDQPQAIAFDAKIVVADSAEPGQRSLTFVNASSYRDVDAAARKEAAVVTPGDDDSTPDAKPSDESTKQAVADAEGPSSMLWYGLIGGALVAAIGLIFVFRARTQHSPSS